MVKHQKIQNVIFQFEIFYSLIPFELVRIQFNYVISFSLAQIAPPDETTKVIEPIERIETQQCGADHGKLADDELNFVYDEASDTSECE